MAKRDKLDASRQQLGNVYAKALLAAADKGGIADLVVEEVEAIVTDVLDKLPHLDQLLRTPRLTHEERLPILEKAFAGKLSATTLTFLKVVSRHNRLDALRAIARAARRQLNELRGRVEVVVETAYPLNNTIQERIANRLTEMLGRQVILQTHVNDELLGGLVVRVGDTVYDASLAMQLKRLEQVTLDKTKQTIRESIQRFAVLT